MQVRQHFDVNRDHVGARVDEGLDEPVGVGDHQVHIQRQRRGLAQRLHHGHANREVGDEVAIHHIHVHLVGAATRDGLDVTAEGREVGRQNGWRQANHLS